MADFNIPMSAPIQRIQPTPVQAPDTELPLRVKPFQPIDMAKASMNADAMSEAQDNIAKRQEQSDDRAVLIALRDSGVNLETPEGIDKALESKKLSPMTLDRLKQHQTQIQSQKMAMEKGLRGLDMDQLQTLHTHLEENLAQMEEPVTAYEAAKKSGDELSARETFLAKAHARINMMRGEKDPGTGKPLYQPQILDAMENWTPQQWKDRVDKSANVIAVTASVRKVKKMEAEAAKDLAQADYWKMGGAAGSKNTVADAIDAEVAAGKITKEEGDRRKTTLVTGGPKNLSGIPEEQITPEERRLAVNQWIQNPSSMRGMDKTYQQRVIHWAADIGITADDVLNGRAAQKFQMASAGASGHRAGVMAGVEAVMPGLIEEAKKASHNVPRGNFVPFTKLQQMTESSLSDPALKKLKLANQAVASEYQQVITRGGSNVTALNEAMELLKTADSQAAYDAALDQVKREVEINKQGLDDVRAGLQPVHTPQLKAPVAPAVAPAKPAASATPGLKPVGKYKTVKDVATDPNLSREEKLTILKQMGAQ